MNTPAFQVVRLRKSMLPVKPILTATPPAPPSHGEIQRRVAELMEQARRMRPPMNHDPERFHIEKSELVHGLQSLEEDLRRMGRSR